MISSIPSFDSCRFLARFLRYAGNRHQVFRPRLHRFACELLSRFQSERPVPISNEALHSLRQCSRFHKVAENFYLSDGVSPDSLSALESAIAPLNSRFRQFFLLNFESRANPCYYSLPVDEVFCLFRHRGLFKEYRSSVFRRFRQIHASERNSEELLASSGNLIVCLAQAGAALFPGKSGARMSLRLIRKFHEEMVISKGNLWLIQEIVLLQVQSSHFKSCSPNNTKNMLNLQHAEVLRSIYPFPPSPPTTEHTPDFYFKKLPLTQAASLKSNLAKHGYGQEIMSRNDRTVVREICQNPHVDPFAAYIVAMAWGGQDLQQYKHFQKTVKSQRQIGTLLDQLRVSVNSRDDDFKVVQAAAKNINGLGISFYTKLLYFFRPMPDAYILDKWTAMASSLLFVPQPIRLGPPDSKGHRAPKIDTTPEEYGQFCSEIDMLPGFLWPGLSVPGDVAELAMFGVPPIPGDKSNKWRKHVGINFPPPQPQQPKSIKMKKAASNKQNFIKQLYPRHTAGGHKLPASMGLISKPALVTPWSAGDVRWVYDPAAMHVRVFKQYKTGAGPQTHQRDLSKITILQNLAQANGWKVINRSGNTTYLGFKLSGNTTPRRGSDQVIAKCLQAMEILFATIP